MRINTNIAALNAHRQMGQTNDAIARSIGRLSSGSKINRAADNAAGLAIANKFRADIRAYRVAQQNTTEANSLLQIAESGASSIGDILERMKELATQAASANSEGQRDKLDLEFQQLLEEIDRIAEGTVYQGESLLNGDVDFDFQIGASGTDSDQLEIELSAELTAAGLGLSGLDLDSQENARAVLTAIDGSPGSPAGPGGTPPAVPATDGAMSSINTVLGEIGAAQNRLDYAAANIASTIENYAASESAIRDADMAFEMTTFTRNQIMQQASIAMLAQANMAPQSVLQLLG